MYLLLVVVAITFKRMYLCYPRLQAKSQFFSLLAVTINYYTN